MFCGNCGAQVPDNLNFCTNCGAELTDMREKTIFPDENGEVTIERPGFKTTYHPVSSPTAPASARRAIPTTMPAPVTAPAQLPHSGLAIAGFVLGVVALCTSFLPIINNASFVLALIGLVFALVGVHQTGKKQRRGNGFAVVGTLMCIASVAVVLLTQTYYSAEFTNFMNGVQTQQASSVVAKTSENLKVGDTVTLEDGLKIKVANVSKDRTSYDGSQVTAVSLIYKNTGGENQSFNMFDWKAEDANGVLQTPTAIVSDGGNSLGSGSIVPGGKASGEVYFKGDMKKLYYYGNVLMQTDSEIYWVL